ncbi:MAG: sodium-dependent transporter, partial [Gemmatimonadetes bacterium]|nr:sodium-dependent transporter [Gemmatimonadota bacterium]
MRRETFSSRATLLATMVGVAVGLGNVWRFPYMVGRFGGAAFVLLYLLFALLIGIPALMAEWTLGRSTQRGTVGAFERAGLPGGRVLGWVFFCTVTAATAYYTNAIGWVAYHGLASGLEPLGAPLSGSDILPPNEGLDGRSFLLQLVLTAAVVLAAVTVILKGLRSGIEKASAILTPLLFLGLLLIIARSLTLPGAGEGVRWYILKFQPSDITPTVALAALGQVIFSLALGGTFMVVYGSYLNRGDSLGKNAVWTVGGDTAAGLLAGLAIFPAVLALGMEPGTGPGLIFETLPQVFGKIPGGWVFGTVFFAALAGAAFLSGVAAFEVLVAGLTDNTALGRKGATWIMAGSVFLLAVPPMINMRVFIPWDLAFGSGAQTAGVLIAVVAVGWGMKRVTVFQEWSTKEGGPGHREILLYHWVRWVIPSAILAVGFW